MAPKKPQKTKLPKAKKFKTHSPASPFVTLKLRPELLEKYGKTDTQIKHEVQLAQQAEAKEIEILAAEPTQDPPDMQTRGAWVNNLANPNRISPTPEDGSASPAPESPAANRRASLSGHDGAFKTSKVKSKPKRSSTTVKRERSESPASPRKRVHFATPDVLEDTDSSSESSGEVETDKENKMADKPKLKLRLSSVGTGAAPGPESATQRTPSIKLNFKSKVESPDSTTPKSSAKKRKHASVSIQDPPVQHPPPNPAIRKLTFKSTTKPEAPIQTPTTPGGIKLKTKGKIPKRPLGVGYDSELDEREADPVIIEGFILRMQPGPDCDYVREAINDGKVGVAQVQGGAQVNVRPLDTEGRRGMLVVKGNRYATSMVDLPCIIEGMKSWDKKGFIKSLDICQMLLVLGPCSTEDEARAYPLPPDVNPQTYEYAHGISAPMKWVRKRRFARTKKLRVGDVEAIDRRVRMMLDADANAEESKFEVLDYDPRPQEQQYNASDEEDEEDDEEDADGEPEDYFATQNGVGGEETPAEYVETPEEEIDDDDVDEFERMIAEVDNDEATNGVPTQDTTHLLPDAGESSFAVTSTSASPSPAAADTPASAATGGITSEDDEENEEERDDDEKDEDENVQQMKERIQELEQRIQEQTETLKRTPNAILKRKLASKIQELQGDVAVMKRNIGMGGDEGDDQGT